MAAIGLLARADLRQRWRSWLLLTLIAGVAGGVVIASVAGARRTATALDRFLDYTRPQTLQLYGDPEVVARAVRVPQVADWDHGAYLLMAPPTPEGRPDVDASGVVNPFLPGTRLRPERGMERALLVAGERADFADPNSITIDERTAERYDLRPGDWFTMFAYDKADFERMAEGNDAFAPHGPRLELKVAGIVRTPFDFTPVAPDDDVVYKGTADIYFTPAFWRVHGDDVAGFGPEGVAAVRLRAGTADLPAFRSAVRALPGGETVDIEVGSDSSSVSDTAEESIEVQAAALYAFAGLVAVVGLAVVAQSIARQLMMSSIDQATVRALGVTRRQSTVARVAGVVPMVTGAVVVAVGLALALSPLAPIGLGRRAEIAPGFRADWLVLGVGALSLVVALLGAAGLVAVVTVRRSTEVSLADPGVVGRGRPSTIVGRLAQLGMRPTAIAGARMALEPGRGAGAVPLRTAVAGTTIAAAAVAAALSFGGAVDRLLGEPRFQGWNWDVVVGDNLDEADTGFGEEGERLLDGNPNVEGYAGVAAPVEPLTIKGRSLLAAGLVDGRGDVGPEPITGRLPSAPDEIAIGTRTADDLGVEIGDVVTARGGSRQLALRIVGTAVISPDLNLGQLSKGALLTAAGLRRFFGDSVVLHQFLVRYAPGVDPGDAYAGLQEDWGRTVLRFYGTPEGENLRRVRGLPAALAGVVALVGVATLAHALLASVRRRRGDLAVLKAIGFSRRDVFATVAWQASLLGGAASLVGVPAGVVLGRWAWRLVADSLGTPIPAPTPWLALLVLPLAAVALANLIAAGPGRQAARTPPAVVLRAE